MRKVTSFLVGGAAATGVLSFIWFGLLDERAKKSVQRAASNTGALARTFVEHYVDEATESTHEEEDQANRDWVEWQWKQAGY